VGVLRDDGESLDCYKREKKLTLISRLPGTPMLKAPPKGDGSLSLIPDQAHPKRVQPECIKTIQSRQFRQISHHQAKYM
jgi:hypothetical protein